MWLFLTPYSRVTWFGTCAVAAYSFSVVTNGNVIIHNSRTDRHRVFKLGGKVGHVTRHVWHLFKVKVTWRISRQKCYNSAVYGHSYQLQTWWELSTLGSTRVVSRSNKPEVEIWRTFSILNAKINGKCRQIAEILHSNRIGVGESSGCA